jgi:PTS system mannose-specific IID component
MSIKTPISIGSDKSEITIQSVLDQVVPSIIPLGLTFLVYYFVKNGAKTTHLLLGLLALGFIGSMIHLFA